MKKLRNYKMISRYMPVGEGWKKTELNLVDYTYEEAGRIASNEAKRLDMAYGDSHFWTVDLVNPETNGSYFQLFHGRLS
jgi:hypothetical protein